MSWVEFVGWARTSQRLFNTLAVAYLITGAALLDGDWFVVIDGRDVAIFVGCAFFPAFLAVQGGFFRGPGAFKRVVVTGHAIAGLLAHPYAMKERDPDYGTFALDRETHDKLLNAFHEYEAEGQARYLAKSLRYRTQFFFRQRHPVQFWLYPTSILLLVWAAIFAIVIPAERPPKRGSDE